MKYFYVEKEELSGMTVAGEVDSDGDYINTPDDQEARTITTGFTVFECGEDGMVEHTEFYPVKTDMYTFENDEDEVLEQIKSDYPAPEWQNHNW